MSAPPEAWLRGPLPDVPPLLQPVAHALLQAKEEVTALLIDFPDDLLWERPAGAASAGFHLQHLSGVLDRMVAYASGRPLTQEQLDRLGNEGKVDRSIKATDLSAAFQRQVEITLKYLRSVPEAILTEFRPVGRAKLPSTVIGLLVHAAEHTMRHTGQLLVTVKVVKDQAAKK